MSQTAVPDVKQEALEYRFKKLKGLSALMDILFFLLLVATVILGIVSENKKIEYDMVPIPKEDFQQYHHGLQKAAFSQAGLARAEEIFSITTTTTRRPSWDRMYNFDDSNLSEESKALYKQLRESYSKETPLSSYTYTYLVGKTPKGLPIILRIGGEGMEKIDTFFPTLLDLMMAARLDKDAAAFPVYGRIVSLPRLADLENKELLTSEDSDIFKFLPEGMSNSQYYSLLATYPVMDIEDTEAFDKQIRQQDIIQKRRLYLWSVVLGVLTFAVFVYAQGISHRAENIAASMKTRQLNTAFTILRIKQDNANASETPEENVN